MDVVERWKLDPAVFTQGGRFEVRTTAGGSLHCVMSALQYPGTNIAFDLEVRVERSGFGWLCDLSAPQLGLDRRVDLVRWLEDEAVSWKSRGP